jgi:phosphatidylglycerophosphate synthase
MVDPSFEPAARRASVCVAFVMLAGTAISLFTRSTWVLSLAGPAVLGVMLVQLGDYASHGSWLPNAFTFARVLVMAWLARIGAQLTGPSLATAILLVFLMDGLDGLVARTTGTTSAQGAHFDAESDAFVLLSVCVIHALRGLSPWVLVAGLLRYAFALLIDAYDLDGALPRSRLGRYTGSAALVGLALAFAPHGPLATLLTVGSTLLLLASFGHALYIAFRAALARGRVLESAS